MSESDDLSTRMDAYLDRLDALGGWWIILGVAVVVALGFGAVIDRGVPDMPATNGVIFVIVLGGFVALLVAMVRGIRLP